MATKAFIIQKMAEADKRILSGIFGILFSMQQPTMFSATKLNMPNL
jgi:hypothetical protein